jgi:hypothetical protein
MKQCELIKMANVKQIIGFIVALIGAYLALVGLRIAVVLPQLNELLLKYPALNNTAALFVLGLILAYIGYHLYNE